MNAKSEEPASAGEILDRLFVYGTLRSHHANPMAGRLREASRSWEPARFQGVKYDLGAYPGVRPSEDPACQVDGELFCLRHPVDPILRVLDAYEGVPQGLFSRREMVVRLLKPGEESGGNPDVRAWVYIYEGPLRA